MYAFLFLRQNPPYMPLLDPVRLLILRINFQLFCKMDFDTVYEKVNFYPVQLFHPVCLLKFQNMLAYMLISSFTLIRYSRVAKN